MALAIMRQADQFAVNGRKRSIEPDIIIDLTLDDSSPLPAKRHKPHNDGFVKKSRLSQTPASSPSAITPSRLTTPSTQLRDGAANGPASGETNFKKPSPFRNRPSWSVSRNEGSSQAPPLVQNLKSSRPSTDLTDDDSPGPLSPKRKAATTPAGDLSDHAIGKFINPAKMEPLVFDVSAVAPSQTSSNVRDSSAPQSRPSPRNAAVPRLLSDVKESTQSKPRVSSIPLPKLQLPPKGFSTETRLPFSTRPVLERPSITVTVADWSPVATPRSEISVIIDNSGRKDLTVHRPKLLSRVQEPPPRSSRRQAVDNAQEPSLKADSGLRPEDVPFSSQLDDEIRKHKAQSKEKKVKQKSIKLDWGEDYKANSTLSFSPKKLISPKKQAQNLLDARFHDNEIQPPITFANDVDDKQLSGKFQFITKNVRRIGIDRAPLQPTDGCKCEGVCRPDTCDCLVDDLHEDASGQTTSRGKQVPYRRIQGPNGKPFSILREEFMDSETDYSERKEIVECDAACGCDETCWNRVVQHGRQIPLEIFMTPKCGFGLRSSVNILKGQFLDLYLGEVITTAELKGREQARGEHAPSYIYDLDWWKGNSDPYHVDSLNFGTPSRFCNHSCDPNCRTFTVMQNRNDKKVYSLAFFASRDIPAGRELTIDYNPQLAGKKRKSPEPGENNVVRCECGAKKCRMRLWPAQRKKRKGRGWVNDDESDSDSDSDESDEDEGAGKAHERE